MSEDTQMRNGFEQHALDRLKTVEAERDRYKEALEEIAKKHFPCEDEPWCIALIAQTALADPKGSTPLGTERK